MKRLQVVGGPPPGDEELRLWLSRYIEQHPHHNTTVLAREDYTGISRPALDQFLAGTYFLSKDAGGQGVKSSTVLDLVRAFREKVEGTTRHGYQQTFNPTRSWVQVQTACNTAIEENVIVVVYGRPGVGKSRCLRQFSLEKMTTQPLTVLCSTNVTARYFVQRLAQGLKLDDRLTTAKLEDIIAEKLKRSPRPIFVDQANYLSEKSLGSVCYIWEIARIPVVLAGTKALYDLFTTSRLTEDVRAQLSSRVAMHYPLAELSTPEAKTIITRALGKHATDDNIAAILSVTQGVYRHVDMLIPRVLQLMKANAQKIERGDLSVEELIARAGSRLMYA